MKKPTKKKSEKKKDVVSLWRLLAKSVYILAILEVFTFFLMYLHHFDTTAFVGLTILNVMVYVLCVYLSRNHESLVKKGRKSDSLLSTKLHRDKYSLLFLAVFMLIVSRFTPLKFYALAISSFVLALQKFVLFSIIDVKAIIAYVKKLSPELATKAFTFFLGIQILIPIMMDLQNNIIRPNRVYFFALITVYFTAIIIYIIIGIIQTKKKLATSRTKKK